MKRYINISQYGHAYDPYKQICKCINEELHILNKNDINYNNKIKQYYNKCINDLFDKNLKLIKLYKNNSILYSQNIINKIFPQIQQCNIFIGINKNNNDVDTFDGYSITFPIDNKEYNFNYHKSLFKIDIDKNQIEICTIIITLPNLKYNELYNNEKFIGIIKYELLHIFHSIIKESLAINAGNAYYYASQLCEIYHINFPDAFGLDDLLNKKLNNNFIRDKEIMYILAGCIYYLDKSEQRAWLDSFNSYDRHALNREKFLETKSSLLSRDPYKIFYCLYKLLLMYKNEIVNIKINNTIKIVFSDLKIKNISSFYNSSLKSLKILLHKCQKIHYSNLIN